MSSGVIAISRKLFDPDDPFFGGEPFSRREAWQWMIAEAAWKPRTVLVTVARTTRRVQLNRGQIAHSRAFMEDAWGWTAKSVRTFLDRLERDGRITREGQETGQHQCTITICKYDEYQFGSVSEGQETGQERANKVEKNGQETGQENGQETGQETAPASDCNVSDFYFLADDAANKVSNEQANEKGQQSRKKGPELEEVINKKRKNTRSADFEEWYSIYPRKRDPDDAQRAYARLVASGKITAADLLRKTKAFAESCAKLPEAERKFIKYPATWLNKGGYANEPDIPATPVAAPPQNPRTFTPARWRELVALHARTGEWGSHWGPPPGAPGCLVPFDILQARSRSPPLSGLTREAEAIR